MHKNGRRGPTLEISLLLGEVVFELDQRATVGWVDYNYFLFYLHRKIILVTNKTESSGFYSAAEMYQHLVCFNIMNSCMVCTLRNFGYVHFQKRRLHSTAQLCAV